MLLVHYFVNSFLFPLRKVYQEVLPFCWYFGISCFSLLACFVWLLCLTILALSPSYTMKGYLNILVGFTILVACCMPYATEREREKGLNLPLGEFTKQYYNLQNLTAIIGIVYILKKKILRTTIQANTFCRPQTAHFFIVSLKLALVQKMNFTLPFTKWVTSINFQVIYQPYNSIKTKISRLQISSIFQNKHLKIFSYLSSAKTNKILKGQRVRKYSGHISRGKVDGKGVNNLSLTYER